MAMIPLYEYQLDAINRMDTGSILCGGVGSGKSRTALAYYFVNEGGRLDPRSYPTDARDLYIITTARKRDTLEWHMELVPFGLSVEPLYSECHNTVTIDSWNNISKYTDVSNAFFIFDEQRVVGKGEWVKSFLKITKKNDWILLSATPGETWTDYIPVFIANGFYRNRTEFYNSHIIWAQTKYPKVEKYINTKKLMAYRDKILVDMDFDRQTVRHNEYITTEYDMAAYKKYLKNRWNPFKNEPMTNASDMCYVLRRICNSDPTRLDTVKWIVLERHKVIVFYNFDYELDMLKSLRDALWDDFPEGTFDIAEWNGHKHQEIPKTENWIYLVQYTAGAEGWNCIETDTIVFFSQNYSYKALEQASGRIDRLNTPFHDLYYYHLRSKSPIDIAIGRAIKEKRVFNERKFTSFESK